MKAPTFISQKYGECQKEDCISILILVPTLRNIKRTHTVANEIGNKVPILTPDSQDLRLTHSTNHFRQATSGKFMFPSIEKNLRYHWALHSQRKTERWAFHEVLGYWFPKVLSLIIYDYYFVEDADWKPQFPFAVEVLEPPYKELPEWLAKCWSSVRWILVPSGFDPMKSAQRLKSLLHSEYPVSIVFCSLT